MYGMKNLIRLFQRNLTLRHFWLILFLLFPLNLNSQNKLGLGVYLGVPTGVTGKYLLSRSNSGDVLLAWRFNDAFFVQGHYNFNLSEIERYKNGVFNFYAGAGLFFKAVSKGDDSFGVSGNIGVNYFLKQKYEFFLELSPKLGLFPGTGFDLTGGIGFRFYL
ncbi:hypothetical protein JGI3_01043 [Candidatus Kryptobacter tengchongensis]|uniref:Outer membrane protein beta-barrel domain-containing protein n=2 Tax=Kryptobacter tengchongensis TaxID=1643429 RepID=A0A656D0W1_KRYT1|nr:hypothetical protein JGI20_01176 [Candidatus Kryptobacter tengchongensis]CUT03054.1 hypothetical protein JGI24_01234 [Candidatus Kryptobacter tengchongensis]CUU04972.1 hypothetical protein JGI3_01043 [Candidatus Kryptobacter tengchongensis]